MDKNAKLLEKFTKTEEKLLKLLKTNDIDVSDDTNLIYTKKRILDKIKNIKKIKQVFEEYESIAKEIETLSKEENVSGELQEDIVNLREESKEKEYIQGYGYEDEVVLEGEIIKVSKKKKTSKKEKQL